MIHYIIPLRISDQILIKDDNIHINTNKTVKNNIHSLFDKNLKDKLPDLFNTIRKKEIKITLNTDIRPRFKK